MRSAAACPMADVGGVEFGESALELGELPLELGPTRGGIDGGSRGAQLLLATPDARRFLGVVRRVEAHGEVVEFGDDRLEVQGPQYGVG